MQFRSDLCILLFFGIHFLLGAKYTVFAEDNTPQASAEAEAMYDDLAGTWKFDQTNPDQTLCTIILSLEKGQYGNMLYSCRQDELYWLKDGSDLIFKDFDGAETISFQKLKDDRWEGHSKRGQVAYQIYRMNGSASTTPGALPAAAKPKPTQPDQNLSPEPSISGNYEELLAQGVKLYNAGSYQAAIEYFRRCNTINPRGWEASYNAALAFDATDNLAEATGAWVKACALNPSAPDACRQALIHAAEGP